MASFYVHCGVITTQYPNDWVVSVGTILNPLVVHFKNQNDMIAYCQGHHERLNDERIKNRYKEITRTLEDDVRNLCR